MSIQKQEPIIFVQLKRKTGFSGSQCGFPIYKSPKYGFAKYRFGKYRFGKYRFFSNIFESRKPKIRTCRPGPSLPSFAALSQLVLSHPSSYLRGRFLTHFFVPEAFRRELDLAPTSCSLTGSTTSSSTSIHEGKAAVALHAHESAESGLGENRRW